MTRHRQKGLPLVDNPTAAPRSAPPASEPDADAPADERDGRQRAWADHAGHQRADGLGACRHHDDGAAVPADA